jgi:hypothetical protein
MVSYITLDTPLVGNIIGMVLGIHSQLEVFLHFTLGSVHLERHSLSDVTATVTLALTLQTQWRVHQEKHVRLYLNLN